MSKAEILEELAKLTPDERAEITAKIREIDGTEWLDPELTDEDKRILDERLAEYEKNPDAGSTWEEVEARIRAKLGR
jgi:putative addiction module component (TIGR02574 family)